MQVESRPGFSSKGQVRSARDDEQPSDRAKPEKIPHITSGVKRPYCQTLEAFFEGFLREGEGGTLSRSSTVFFELHFLAPDSLLLKNTLSASDALRTNKPFDYYLLDRTEASESDVTFNHF